MVRLSPTQSELPGEAIMVMDGACPKQENVVATESIHATTMISEE
jgi:hypothetical protein